MFRTLFAALILVSAASAGCFGDKDKDGASPTTSGTNPPSANETVNLTVSIINHTTQGKVGGKINVTWEVSLPPSLNQTFNTTHTHVHWGNLSVPDAAAGNYTNETEEQSGGVPGTYNTTFTVNKAGDVYFRAHAVLGNKSYWSDEFKINVTAAAPAGTTHIITIGAAAPNFGPLSRYNPTPKTIKVGDTVKWKNEDPALAGNVHTATGTSAAAAAFNTGNISPGATHAGILFTKVGSYPYECANHASTMTGSLTVQ